MSKPRILQLSEVDITQKIIEALSNVCTRAVLFSVRDESKDAVRVSDELNLSLSTVYKSFAILMHLALAEVERYEISADGKKTKIYRSRIGKVEIILDGQEPLLSLFPNTTGPKQKS